MGHYGESGNQAVISAPYFLNGVGPFSEKFMCGTRHGDRNRLVLKQARRVDFSITLVAKTSAGVVVVKSTILHW